MKQTTVRFDEIEYLAYYDGPFLGTARSGGHGYWFQLIYDDWHGRYRALGFYSPALLSIEDLRKLAKETTAEIGPLGTEQHGPAFHHKIGELLSQRPAGEHYLRTANAPMWMSEHRTVEAMAAAGLMELLHGNCRPDRAGSRGGGDAGRRE